jgi:hypothetical protein
MAISNFLNPIDEEDEDTDQPTADDILQDVIDEHLGVDGIPDNDEEDGGDGGDGGEGQVQPQYTSNDALRAIQVLIECTETTDNLPTKYIRSLESLETVFKGIREQSKEQQTLDNWLI